MRAGFSGFVLHRELVKQGINNIVVHAAGVEVAVNNRVKTDKRDAQKLAALLEAGRLKGIGIPTQALLATPDPDANQRTALIEGFLRTATTPDRRHRQISGSVTALTFRCLVLSSSYLSTSTCVRHRTFDNEKGKCSAVTTVTTNDWLSRRFLKRVYT